MERDQAAGRRPEVLCPDPNPGSRAGGPDRGGRDAAGSDHRSRTERSARLLRPRVQNCGVRPRTSQRRLLLHTMARAIYTLLKIAFEAAFQSEMAEFELNQ
jgi:hypothetical protein